MWSIQEFNETGTKCNEDFVGEGAVFGGEGDVVAVDCGVGHLGVEVGCVAEGGGGVGGRNGYVGRWGVGGVGGLVRDRCFWEMGD